MPTLERIRPKRLKVVPHLDGLIHPPRINQIDNADKRTLEILLALADGLIRLYPNLIAQALVPRELLRVRELPVGVVLRRLGEVVQLYLLAHGDCALAV